MLPATSLLLSCKVILVVLHLEEGAFIFHLFQERTSWVVRRWVFFCSLDTRNFWSGLMVCYQTMQTLHIVLSCLPCLFKPWKSSFCSIILHCFTLLSLLLPSNQWPLQSFHSAVSGLVHWSHHRAASQLGRSGHVHSSSTWQAVSKC